MTKDFKDYGHLEKVILLIGYAFNISNRNEGLFQEEDVTRLIDEYALDAFTAQELEHLRLKLVANENDYCQKFLQPLDKYEAPSA